MASVPTSSGVELSPDIDIWCSANQLLRHHGKGAAPLLSPLSIPISVRLPMMLRGRRIWKRTIARNVPWTTGLDMIQIKATSKETQQVVAPHLDSP